VWSVFKASGSSPLRGQSACAKRAVYQQPPPVFPHAKVTVSFKPSTNQRKAALRGAFPFLASKHALGLSFELRDHQLPTSSDLTPELLQCLGSALDKILHMCDGFRAESDEVFILRNFAIILPQLLFVYGTRTEQVRRAVDFFNQGKWQDLWKLANKAGESQSKG